VEKIQKGQGISWDLRAMHMLYGLGSGPAYDMIINIFVCRPQQDIKALNK